MLKRYFKKLVLSIVAPTTTVLDNNRIMFMGLYFYSKSSMATVELVKTTYEHPMNAGKKEHKYIISAIALQKSTTETAIKQLEWRIRKLEAELVQHKENLK